MIWIQIFALAAHIPLAILAFFIGKRKGVGARGGVAFWIFGTILFLIWGSLMYSSIGGAAAIVILCFMPADKNDWEYKYEDEHQQDETDNTDNIASFNKKSSVNELKRLRYMKDTGAITEEEFEAKKKELMG